MSKGHLKIHSENILPIIKKWLYSEKDIFVRELVSNANDAIKKLVILKEQGQATLAEDETFRIDIKIDKENKTLTFSDNGLGMTAEEVEKYIAQLAFSGAEEFVNKYSKASESDQIIGHFGLGFYSAYMVAKNVEINTLSFQENSKPVFWSCDGTSEYEISEGSKASRGTDITLQLEGENEEYLDPAHIRTLLLRYCAFLPYPIYLNDEQINDVEPLWTKNPSEVTDEEYVEFYRHLFPYEQEPLFWVHLNVDYPFHLKGILYFPKIRQENELKKDSIKLFCNRVFVSDNCRDLLPEYLTILKGAIDSPDIPLNVSRSYLQMDKTVRQVGLHISKKVSDRLIALYRTEREKFLKCWEDVELILKYGSLHDEKFYDRVKEILIWKNNQGEWSTIEDYLVRCETSHNNTVYYATEEKQGSPFLNLYKEKNIEVLFTSSYLDQALIHTIERRHGSVKFQRIDSAVSDTLLDPSKEKTVLDEEGRTEASRLAEFVKNKLGIENVEVEAKSLASPLLPGVILIKEDERRLRDHLNYTNREGAKSFPFFKPTFVVNTNSKLFEAIQSLNAKEPDLAKEMILEVYDLACLSQKEMEPEGLTQFVERSNKILEKLVCKLVENQTT